MSANNTQETEQLIIKLLKKLERKGKNIQSFLWKLMDEFEGGQFDEKNDENKSNTKNTVSLLHDPAYKHVCKVGHGIRSDEQKHLAVDPCIICGHRNNNIQNKTRPNNEQAIKFLNQYDTNQVPFGPHQKQKRTLKVWVSNGNAKKWPLHYAAISGDIEKIKQLSSKNINIDQPRTDFNDKTPITLASRYGQIESVIELIKNGANEIPTPDRANDTPYRSAVYNQHESVIVFFEKYTKYLYNFEINTNTNLECYKCYAYDSHFNTHMINGTMSKYVYCANCGLENVNKIKKTQENNLRIETRIIKTIRDNPSISVDTLCQMKDVKSLHTILKEIMVSGSTHAYWVWLIDIDNFKLINTHLTHAIADTKIQALGEELKKLEAITFHQWIQNGYDGLNKVWVFRQGGDEFALVTWCNSQKKRILQKLYERLRNSIKNIKLENMTMAHLTVSIGVCNGQAIDDYQEMMKKADEAAEIVKRDGKNGIAIYYPIKNQTYRNFTHI